MILAYVDDFEQRLRRKVRKLMGRGLPKPIPERVPHRRRAADLFSKHSARINIPNWFHQAALLNPASPTAPAIPNDMPDMMEFSLPVEFFVR